MRDHHRAAARRSRLDYARRWVAVAVVIAGSQLGLQCPVESSIVILSPTATRDAGDCMESISFELVGTRSNRDAVGALIRLRAGDAWQTRVVASGSGYLSGSSLRQHFGLGDRDTVDGVEISWPSGLRSGLRNLSAHRRAYRGVA